MGKGIVGNKVPAYLRCYSENYIKVCRSGHQPGSITLGLSPLLCRPASLLWAHKGRFHLILGGQLPATRTGLPHFCRTSMDVFVSMCVCRWRGCEHMLKKLSSSAGGWKLPGSALRAPKWQQMEVDWTENSGTLYFRLKLAWNCLTQRTVFLS